MTRHFLSMADLTATELALVLDLSEDLQPPQVLTGLGVALLFEHPSARTRNAAEVAVAQLGGHPVSIRGEEVGIDRRETAEDVARTLACYHAVVAGRVTAHRTLERMVAALDAGSVGVPVVNLLSDHEHPTQALADLLTLRQHFGHLEGLKVAYVGDANNVCRSLALAGALARGTVHVASPPGYRLPAADLQVAEELGGRVLTFDDAAEAVEGVDAIYTDVWISMGQETEAEMRRAAFATFTIDEALAAHAKDGAIIMHCLPAHRGEEISIDALEGPRSVVWQQAANRLHVIRGLLRFLHEAVVEGAAGDRAAGNRAGVDRAGVDRAAGG